MEAGTEVGDPAKKVNAFTEYITSSEQLMLSWWYKGPKKLNWHNITFCSAQEMM